MSAGSVRGPARVSGVAGRFVRLFHGTRGPVVPGTRGPGVPGRLGPLVLGTLGALVLLTLSGCGGEGRGTASGPPTVGEVAPAYAAAELSGETVRLADLRGRPVLLNFWATWCTPCRTETPFLQSLHRRYSEQGLQVVGVSMDSPGAAEGIRRFADEMGVSYRILHDPAQVGMDRFSILGLPATYVLDAEGTVRFVRIGPVSETDEEFLSILEEVAS